MTGPELQSTSRLPGPTSGTAEAGKCAPLAGVVVPDTGWRSGGSRLSAKPARSRAARSTLASPGAATKTRGNPAAPSNEGDPAEAVAVRTYPADKRAYQSSRAR